MVAASGPGFPCVAPRARKEIRHISMACLKIVVAREGWLGSPTELSNDASRTRVIGLRLGRWREVS